MAGGDRSDASRGVHRGLLARAFRVLGIGIGLLAAFVGVLIASVVLYTNSAPGRRFLVAQINQALEGTFRGTIQIEGVQSLRLSGLSGASVTVRDPSGRPVLVAHGISLGVAICPLIRSILFAGNEPLTIALEDASIRDLDVRLDTDATGRLALVNTFEMKHRGGLPERHARGLRIAVLRIVIKKARVHGAVAGLSPFDVDVDGLAGSFAFASDLLELQVLQANLIAHRLANGADLSGSLEGRAKIDTGPLPGISGRLAWRGSAGSLAHSVNVSIERDLVNATLDIPSFGPEDVRTLWSGSTIEASGAARAEARGTWPSLQVDAHALLGQATFDAKGNVIVAEHGQANFAVAVHDLDIHQFTHAVPVSRLSMSGDLSVLPTAGATDASLALRVLGGTLGAVEMPPAQIRATGAGRDLRDLRVHADIDLNEPGIPSRITLDLAPKEGSSALHAAIESSAADLAHLPWLKRGLRGMAHATLEGTLDLGTMVVDARLNASVANGAYGFLQFARALLKVHFWGPVANPSLDAALHGEGLTGGALFLAEMDVTATGSVNSSHIVASARGPQVPTTDASADLRIDHGVWLRGLRLELATAGERAIVTADSVRVAGASIHIEAAHIVGLGAPATVTFDLTDSALHIRALDDGIDLARLGRLANMEQRLSGGLLAVDVDVNATRYGATGRGSLDLENATFVGFRNLSARLQVALDGRRLEGTVHAAAGPIGFIDVNAPTLALGGAGPIFRASWQDLWGNATFNARANLGALAVLIPAARGPFAGARGDLAIAGSVDRDNLARLPDMKVSLQSDGLALTVNAHRLRKMAPAMGVDARAWPVQGVDFNVSAAVAGDSGRGDLAVQFHDARGTLAEIDIALPNLPSIDQLCDSARLAIDARRLPFDIRLIAPERELGGLPPILNQDAVTGRVGGIFRQAELFSRRRWMWR